VFDTSRLAGGITKCDSQTNLTVILVQTNTFKPFLFSAILGFYCVDLISSIRNFLLRLQMRLIDNINPSQCNCAADPLDGVGDLTENWNSEDGGQDRLPDQRGGDNRGG
jgi:hypothetical protein